MIPSSPLELWPVVVVIEDCYVPAWAEEVLKQAEKANLDLIGATITCWAYQAERELAGRRN